MRRIDGYTRSLVDFDGARWVAMPMNAGQATTRGLELEAKFPLKAVMRDAPAIDLRASLSGNWSRVEGVPGPDNRLDGQTPLSSNLGIDYKRGDLSTGASFAWKKGGLVRVSERQTSTLQTRRELEAFALYKFNPKQQLRVALSNILGQDFVNRGSFAEPERGLVERETRFKTGPSVRATFEMEAIRAGPPTQAGAYVKRPPSGGRFAWRFASTINERGGGALLPRRTGRCRTGPPNLAQESRRT